jgi:hypothetical protein
MAAMNGSYKIWNKFSFGVEQEWLNKTRLVNLQRKILEMNLMREDEEDE